MVLLWIEAIFKLNWRENVIGNKIAGSLVIWSFLLPNWIKIFLVWCKLHFYFLQAFNLQDWIIVFTLCVWMIWTYIYYRMHVRSHDFTHMLVGMTWRYFNTKNIRTINSKVMVVYTYIFSQARAFTECWGRKWPSKFLPEWKLTFTHRTRAIINHGY